jgi:hypothetical protein
MNMANTWNSTSTTSSKASSLFSLDEDDTSHILVYKYRSGCKSLDVSSQHDLCKALDSGKLAPLSHRPRPLRSCASLTSERPLL